MRCHGDSVDDARKPELLTRDMALSVEEFIARIGALAKLEDIQVIRQAEQSHEDRTRAYARAHALTAGFQSFVLTTNGAANSIRSSVPQTAAEHYGLFIVRTLHGFQSISAADRLGAIGYPMQAFTIVRNVFDSLVLTSAAAQGFATWWDLYGIEQGKSFDAERAKRLRKAIEFRIRNKMTGVSSGLSEATIKDLGIVNRLFDYEVHDSKLSLVRAMAWFKGEAVLSTTPSFDKTQYELLLTRLVEVQWMTHRLLPLMQCGEGRFSEDWRKKWNSIDELFASMADSLSRLADDKPERTIGRSITEFVKIKFPFSSEASFLG